MPKTCQEVRRRNGHVVGVWMPDEDREAVREAARRSCRTVSAFCLWAARKAVEEVSGGAAGEDGRRP